MVFADIFVNIEKVWEKKKKTKHLSPYQNKKICFSHRSPLCFIIIIIFLFVFRILDLTTNFERIKFQIIIANIRRKNEMCQNIFAKKCHWKLYFHNHTSLFLVVRCISSHLQKSRKLLFCKFVFVWQRYSMVCENRCFITNKLSIIRLAWWMFDVVFLIVFYSLFCVCSFFQIKNSSCYFKLEKKKTNTRESQF